MQQQHSHFLELSDMDVFLVQSLCIQKENNFITYDTLHIDLIP